ncbi:DUF1996 domain-containing protein [Streptacidiphilus sp. MAP12-16]|uniref:DUF1996 domain-containing protein n=1 Tax=Streptacidiphilus sp. MAP12-16 TaxID=3156300 RepID=UPI0035150C01
MILPLGILLSLVLGLGLAAFHLTSGAGGLTVRRSADISADYVAIASVPAAPPAPAFGPGASTGSYAEDCGRNENGLHRNADNVVISPGVVGGAHHVHDYVGNLSTTAVSTDATLAAAGTTCTDGDRSTFYWPVLRRTDRPGTDTSSVGGGVHHNVGEILTPAAVQVEFLGNPVSEVVPMPRFLRLLTGDPVAATDGGTNARAEWGCAGFPGRVTGRYPLCPSGSSLTRTLDFPSCWDGRSTDSPDHRAHVVFPAANGVCPHDTFPVPQLRVVLSYDLPPGVPFALDSFPEQLHDPITEHALFVDVMTDRQMAAVVACVNRGRQR